MTYVLAIETSCDDTSVALVGEDRKVLCCLVASQDLVHKDFGGVVPEIASRSHTQDLMPLIDQALSDYKIGWDDILGIAVTNRPGLVGSLIVGLVTAKALALASEKPFIGIHHIEGHIMAPFLKDDTYPGEDFYDEDFAALVVSGGHTQLYKVQGFGNYQRIGETLDDAAGEAFDKFAKKLGLPYPGGVQVDRLAQLGNPKAHNFPRPMISDETFNFSFSGLKAAAIRQLPEDPGSLSEEQKADLCASYQQAIVDVLVTKLKRLLKEFSLKRVVISGGVSANSGLRQASQVMAEDLGVHLALPPLRYCTDNAAMIGLVGLLRLKRGESSSQQLKPEARSLL